MKQGKLQHDPYQEEVAFKLENLLGRMEQYEKDMKEYHVGHDILLFPNHPEMLFLGLFIFLIFLGKAYQMGGE